MKQLKSFIKKEFFHILRDPRTMLILFGIPITQLLIFGTVIKNEISDVHIAIYDQSKDETTMQITNKLLSSGYFILNQNLESTDGIEAIFKKGKVKQVIVFENDFGQKLIREGNASVQLIADATDPNLARLVTSYTTGIVNDYIKKMHPNLQMPLKTEPEVRMYFNEEMKSAYQFVPGTMALILMLISALMTSISITREKEMGTMEILLVSPLKPVQIIIGKVLPYLILSIINGFIIVSIGHFVFGVPVTGSFVLLMLETILFILMGGIFTPVESMPSWAQIANHINPIYYLMRMLRMIILKGSGFFDLLEEFIALSGLGILFLSLAIWKYRKTT
ncbi:MAG: ABC transporter permease [Mariniphaga sp.]|nr:ABC transporter permease [Mariniphaga sp.]